MLLLERVGLIIILAYVLMNIPYFKNLMNRRRTWKARWQLCIIFSLFALMSNLTGIVIDHQYSLSGSVYFRLDDDVSLANTRVLTIGVAGLVGGTFCRSICWRYFRYFQSVYGWGGCTSLSYLIYIYRYNCWLFWLTSSKTQTLPSIAKSAMIGIVMEMIQMLSILTFSHDKAYAVDLISLIALPMIIVNSVGTAIFMSIIISTLKQEEQMKAVQTHDVLQLMNQTLPYFKEGLNRESAQQIAMIIKNLMKVSAVAITSKNEILSHVGAGSDHHIPTNEILTSLSKDVLKSGKLKEVHTKEEIGCSHPNCPLRAAIVIPLEMHGSIVGTLKMYFTNPNDLTFVERQLAEGLANIFSSQIELGEAETQSKLLKDAEIKSLQAQVSPHFFFNSINTISALVRINSEKARELLLELSYFFRANLQGSKQHTITLDKELSQVRAYLSLEQARYPGRFNININVEDKYRDVLVPPFLIQILVENAIKHAFTNRKQGNDIDVSVIKETATHVRIIVQDNGQGISKDKMHLLGETSVESESGTGSALENLNLRLKGLFGKSAALQFESTSSGTTFWCVLPYERQEEE